MRKFKKQKLVLFIFAFLFFGGWLFFQPEPVWADDCADCLELQEWKSCLAVCWQTCPYAVWTNTELSRCDTALESPQNTCTGSSGGDSACGYLGPWSYCYASACQVKAKELSPGYCDYQYQYSYINCGAYDTCEGGPYLKAGRCGSGTACDSSQCRVGGTYKTCCQVSGGNFTGNLGESCTGGCRTGVCPAGSAAVICGVSSCAGIGAACTLAPCGVGACQALAAQTPPPGEPIPTQPPGGGGGGGGEQTSACGSCDGSYYACTEGTGCGVGPCERITWGIPWPEGNCSPCFNKGWDLGCGWNRPARATLYLPNDEEVVYLGDTETVFSWYKYGGGEDLGGPGCSGGCNKNGGPRFCWGYHCAMGSYGMPNDTRMYELFISRVPDLSRARAEAKNPADWQNPEVRIRGGDEVNLGPGKVSKKYVLLNSTTERLPGTYWWFIRSCFVLNDVGHCNDSYLRSFRLTYPPPTCEVQLSRAIRGKPDEEVQITFSGSKLGPDEPTKLWIEKRDASKVTGINKPDDYLSESVSGAGKHYYKIAECFNDGSGSCTGNINLSSNWPGGQYYLHCDVSVAPGICSGNPFCNYDNNPAVKSFCLSCPSSSGICGTDNCCDSSACWQPCSSSANDKKCFCINSYPDPATGLIPDGQSYPDNMNITLSWINLADGNWGVNCAGNDNRYFVYYCKDEGPYDNCSASEVPNTQDCTPIENEPSLGRHSCTIDNNGEENLDWESTYYWKVVTSNGALTAEAFGSFEVTHPSAWWQTKTGDVYGKGGIVSPIWREASPLFFSLKSEIDPAIGPQSGLVASANLGANDFSGDVTGLNAKGENQATETEFSTIDHQAIDADFTPLLNDYSYAKLSYLVDLAIKEDNPKESYNKAVRVVDNDQIDKSDLTDNPSPDHLYYYPSYDGGAVSMDDEYFSIGANETFIVFVDDDLHINQNITVASGGFLAFIVKGDIEIDSDVAQVQGVYFADGSLTVETGATPANPELHDGQFNGQGIFVAKAGVSLKRNFRNADNVTTPTEIFTFDPAYLFTAPKVFREKPYLWQEVIP